MKKIYQIVMLCAMGIALASCGDNAEKKCAELEQDYREACENKEFAKAYAAVAELRAIYTEINAQEPKRKHPKDFRDFDLTDQVNHAHKRNDAHENYLKAEKYVVIHEALTAIETNGTKGLGRVAIIAKEHPMCACYYCRHNEKSEYNNPSWIYEVLLEYAKSSGDEELQTRIQNIIDKNSNTQDSENQTQQ